MALHPVRLANSLTFLMAGFVLVSTALQADTRITSDYIALVVEAEDHSSKEDRWVLTDPATPAQDNDPDPNHSDLAVGQAYLELLPDIRVTHDDPFGPPTAIWNVPGSGPRAEYSLDFPEAGRYYVHVRAYSTGTEDNGLHVGLDGTFPDSGARMQFCTAAQKAWAWSGRQRDSGGMGSCGAQKTIWVTVPDAGVHTFMISAREDGFEIDRIMLIKDLSDNTRICKPSGADDISCVNGSLVNVDDVVDMTLTLERLDSGTSELELTDSIDISAVVRNADGYDTAQDVSLDLDLGLGVRWDAVVIDDACSQQGESVTCDLGAVAPSGPEGEKVFDFQLTPLLSGAQDLTGTVTTSSVDGNQVNDSASLALNVGGGDILSTLSAVILESGTAWVAGNESTLQFTITNEGPADALDIEATLSLPAGVSVSSSVLGCTDSTPAVCTQDLLAVNASTTFELGITPADPGLFSVSVSVTGSNLDAATSDQAFDSIIVTAADPDSEPAVDGTGNAGDTRSEETAGSTGSGSLGIWLLCLLGMSLLAQWMKISRTAVRAPGVTPRAHS